MSYILTEAFSSVSDEIDDIEKGSEEIRDIKDEIEHIWDDMT